MLTRLYRVALVRALTLSESMRRLTLRGLMAYLALVSPAALADGDLASMMNAASEGAASGTKSILTIAQFVGVCGVFGSLIGFKSMKNNPQIKPAYVGLGFVISLLLIAIPEIIKRGQTQLGMTPVAVG